jgi:SAM-dependent methyltransferase
MRADRDRWEQRYRRRGRHALDPPSQLLQRYRHAIPPGPVLDIAAGDGRNALYLARHGFSVAAVDIAFGGLRRIAAAARREGLRVQLIQADLDSFPLPRRRYAAVVNIRYLQRPLFEPIKEALLPGGLVIFETFLIDQRFIGHPTSPDHLLQHGELAAHFAGFEILCSEEGRFATESGDAFLGRLVARRPPRSL